MLVEGLETYLAANTALQALLGTPATRKDGATGIWPVQAPDQPAAPWIVFQQMSGQPLQESFQGTGRLKTARWRFTCYGSTYKQATKLAEALADAMISLDGSAAGSTVEIHGCWLRLELDEAESMPRGTVFASHRDFQINYYDLH
jgi:hypothetical protein